MHLVEEPLLSRTILHSMNQWTRARVSHLHGVQCVLMVSKGHGLRTGLNVISVCPRDNRDDDSGAQKANSECNEIIRGGDGMNRSGELDG
jgi:hypothetical protein